MKETQWHDRDATNYRQLEFKYGTPKQKTDRNMKSNDEVMISQTMINSNATMIHPEDVPMTIGNSIRGSQEEA